MTRDPEVQMTWKPDHRLVRQPWYRTMAVRGSVLLAGVLLVSALAGMSRRADADVQSVPPTFAIISSELSALMNRAQKAETETASLKATIERQNQVIHYSTRFRIPADQAGAIYRVATSEGIEPDVAFRLIKIESNFDPDAISSAGAIGYTQIRPATARFFESGISAEQLAEPEINLRLGFRFLRSLIRQYDGDINLALLAYNRGPARVQEILDAGGDPANGYPERVLKGTRHAVGAAKVGR
ncbi:MAG: lytic transglycosylase domain-containing protein [Gemmatimonadota bacterium]